MGIKAVKLFFKGITVIMAIVGLIIAAVISRAFETSPEESVWLQFAVIGSPLVILYNFAFLIYWLLRKRVWLLIPLTALIINHKFITSAVGLGFLFPQTEIANYKKLTIGSFNVNYFSYMQEINVSGIAALVSRNNADIMSLQEFKPSIYYNLEELKGEFDFLPYSTINIGEGSTGMAILSKYPVIRSDNINFKGTNNGILWADIQFYNDTVRVINIHLQTTGYYSSYGFGKMYMLQKMKENYLLRAQQSYKVRHLIDTTLHPVIVCGDFNDVPHSYVYSTIMGNDLNDSFKQSEFKLGGTYFFTMGLLRIDHILHSNHFKTLKFKNARTRLSDHRPIFSVLEYQN